MSVFTPVSATELSHFLEAYRLGALLGHQGIAAGVENTNFFVTTTQGEFVLTLFEQYEFHELDYFLQLTEYLADAGIPTARPQHDKAGNRLLELNGRPAALVARLPGQTLTQPNAAQCSEIGAVLAKIHLAGRDFPLDRPPDRGHAWRLKTARHLLPELPPADAALLQTEITQQNAVPFQQLPAGVIHADLFCDNALFEHGSLSGIIDWYYACNDSWLYDLAVVVNDWCCRENGTLDPQRLEACLSAYQQVRPLQSLEREHWGTLLRAAALRFWLSRLLAILYPKAGSMVLQKDPAEFRQKLQHRQTETALIRACWPGTL